MCIILSHLRWLPALFPSSSSLACLPPSTKAILPLLEAQGLGQVTWSRNMISAINRGLGTAGATVGIPVMLH